MQFASLGSGSKGNATLVRAGDTLVLIDCGFTLRETIKRLSRLGVSPQQLDAVLVTHEHSDHIGGVGPLVRKYQLPLYMTTVRAVVVLLVTIGMCVFSGLLAMRKLKTLDPAEVF